MAEYPPPLNYDAGSSQFIFEDWFYSQQATSYNTAVSLIEQSKNDILNGAPEQLDTLKELSAAIQDNELFGQDTITALGQTVKLTGNQTIAGNKTFSNNVTINGTLTNSGNTTFGDAVSDNLVVNSSVKFYNDIQFGVNGGNDDKITLWGQSQFQNKSCFRDGMLNKGADFYSEGGLYLGKYSSSGTGCLAVPDDVGAVGGFRFLNISNATGNISNEPLQIFKEGNTKFNYDMKLLGRGEFQGGAVFTDAINSYAGQTDIYATQGLYLGAFSNGRAVLGCPNNGTANGFQFSNLDKDGNILNSPFYITQEGVCVTNGKLQVSADEFKVVDGALVTLPVDSVSQSAVNGLTTELDNKANDAEVVHLSNDEIISGEKTFNNAIKFNKSIVIGNGAIFEPDNTIGKLYCREGVSISNGAIISGGTVIAGGLTVNSGAYLNLPTRGVSDEALSTNIPLKDGTNVFSGICGFNNMSLASNGSFSMSENSTLNLLDNSISDTALSSNIVKKNATNTFTGANGFDNLTISSTGGLYMSAGSTLSLQPQSIPVSRINNSAGEIILAADSNTFADNTEQTFWDIKVNNNADITQQLIVRNGLVLPTGSDIYADDSLLTCNRVVCNAITSATKLVVDSGLNLRSAQTNLTSDLIGAGTVESETINAQDILFTGNINSISTTEFNYLSGTASNIQNQLNTKAPLESPSFTGIPTVPTAVSTTNSEQIATTAFVKTQISDLLGGAGPSIDTLLELNNVLAQADSDLSTSLTALIGTKAPISNPSFTGTVNGVTKSMVGLSNVDNTSDLNKPVSTATQSALNLKADASLISNIDNTSDLNKPVSTATQSALDLKADALSISNINNTSDADKPVSTAQQLALDLKADASLISNIDNTSDLNKPVSTATQSALDLKADASSISNIDNTSDLNKPVSTAQQLALDLKADASLVDVNIIAIQNLATDLTNNNISTIANTNNLLLKVDTSLYDTEKAVQNTNIANNATAIANNATAIASKLSTATYNADKATQDALIATKTDTSYVDNAISNLVNGAGSSLDTLNELATALGNDPNFATTITNQIGTKLSTATYTANKIATDNRLDAIESVDSQQLNLSGGTITGDFVSRQTVNMMEVLNTATVSASAVSLNYSLGSVFYITLPSATNFEVQITNCNPASSSSTTNTISLIINTGTYEAFANTCKINGLTRALTFAGGSVDITGASQVLQTISVVYSGSSSVPVAVMSSVVPFSTLA